MIQQVFEIVCLMSGDEQGAFIIHGATDDTFQGLPGGDIQAVGRFVEQGEGSVQG